MQNNDITTNSSSSNEVVWMYNLYRSFMVHTIQVSKEDIITLSGVKTIEKKSANHERTIFGVDYGNYGEQERSCVAVLFTIPKLTWAKITNDQNCGFLTSVAYSKEFCNGGYSSLRECFESAKKSFNDRLDKYGKLKRGAINVSKENLNVDKLLSTSTDYDSDEDGVIFEESIMTAKQYKGEALKEFVTNVRLENLNKGYPYEFDFYPIYTFDLESKKDLLHKYNLEEIR